MSVRPRAGTIARPVDAVVVGGGLVGCLSARALSRAGLSVTLFERRPGLGREASTAAAGMLSPQMEAAEDLLVEVPDRSSGQAMLDLCLAAREAYPSFVAGLEAETGRDVHYRRDGTLVVALTAVEAGRHARTAESQGRLGLPVEFLDATAARRLEPALTEALAGALHFPDDHQVDTPALMGAVEATVRKNTGIEVATGVEVRSLLSRGGAVRGVEADGRKIETGLVVLAAGAWSGTIAGLPRPLPVRPVKGQMAALRSARPPIGRVVGGRGAYCVPREDGRILVGATVEERGFEDGVSRVELDALIAAATEIVPALADAEVVARWAGLRPGTPDSLPVLGPDPELAGLLYATGHYRNGILLAPLTAECVAALAVGDPSPVDLRPFAPGREALHQWHASG